MNQVDNSYLFKGFQNKFQFYFILLNKLQIMSSKSAIFKNKIDVSGNLDISGDLTVSNKIKLNNSSTLNLHSLDIPSLPTDLCGQVLAVNSTGDDLEWIKSDSVGGSTSDANVSNFYENATIDTSSTINNSENGFYKSLLSTLNIPPNT